MSKIRVAGFGSPLFVLLISDKVQKNKDLVDSGDRYTIIGGSLIGAGIVVFGLGLVLSF